MSKPAACERVAGSFRDPDGFLFTKDGVLYRQVNGSCRADYDMLMRSGLYEELAGDGLLVPHEETALEGASPLISYKVLKPERVPFISYPYEWCFGQLKDAALLVLEAQKRALGCGMSLKDASAYNVQFRKGLPVLIDTLSFEAYKEGGPWIAYGQFCSHFLAPLALISKTDVRLNRLSRVHIDGIPLDLASKLLPGATRFDFPLLTHIHLHAACRGHFAKNDGVGPRGTMRRSALVALIDSLHGAVSSLRWRPKESEWSSYYRETTYDAAAFGEKRRLVSLYLDSAAAGTVWDLGANTGVFSRVAASRGRQTIAMDADASCAEQNYRECLRDSETRVLPLVIDLTNPSPAVGWENKERSSLLERGPAGTALALALVHHLALANNLPLERVAAFMKKVCRSLIVEFVPKTDPQVRRLLAAREDIFPRYTRQGFEEAFSKFFTIEASSDIQASGRTLYLMEKK